VAVDCIGLLLIIFDLVIFACGSDEAGMIGAILHGQRSHRAGIQCEPLDIVQVGGAAGLRGCRSPDAAVLADDRAKM